MKKLERLFNEGLDAGTNRDYAKAVEIFSLLAQEEYPEALLYLGRSYHGMENYSRAYQCLKLYTDQFPGKPEGYFFAGRSLANLGEYRRALKFFQKAESLGLKSSQLWTFMGLSYLKVNKARIALRLLEKAVKMEPENTHIFEAYKDALGIMAIKHFHGGDHDMASDILKFLRDNDRRDNTTLFYLASSLKAKGDFESALDIFEELYDNNPGDHSLGLQLGELYHRQGYDEDAKEIFSELEKVMPQISEWKKSPLEIPLLLPYQYFLEDNFPQALTLALTEFKKNPQVSSLALLVGESAFRLDHYKLAMDYFQKAKKLSPDAVEPRLGILECYWHMEEYEEFQGEFLSIADQLEEKDRAYYAALSHCKVGGDPLQGVRLLGQAIELKGIDGILLVEYGRQLILAGKKDLALKWIKQGLKSVPGNKGLMDLVAEHFPPEQENKKKSPLPLSEWKTYLKEHPDDNRARFQMAQNLLKTGKFTEAQKHLLKLLTKGYSTENLLRALAWTYRKLGDYTEAYVVYQQLLQQSPAKVIFVPPMLLCLIKLGNPQRAELISKRLAAKKGVPYEILVEIANLFTKAGLLEQGMNLWRKASQLSPKDPSPLEGMSKVYALQGKNVLAKEFEGHAAKLRKTK